MGGEEGDEDEKPAHQVTVSGFWLGRHEVTNAQYARFLAATGAKEPSYWQEAGYDDPNQPVVGVTWRAAAAYCQWAGLRLPTEAEWEYAAAAGRQLKYPTSTGRISQELANYGRKPGKDRWEGPAPVGRFPPNPFGLHDMAGNAWEWTGSLFAPYPFRQEPSTTATRGLRMMRGGCWQYAAEYCRTAHRHRFAEHLTLDFAGFRVAGDGPVERAARQINEPTAATSPADTPPGKDPGESKVGRGPEPENKLSVR